LGTNKRYGDRPQVVKRWVTPWSPIKISECEWIILRDSIYHPAAIVRRLDFPDGSSKYRVVTWAEKSEDRTLLGYTRNLELADMMVPFSAEHDGVAKPPWMRGGATAEDWATRANQNDIYGPPAARW
jgi:hypothetical protein